MLATTAQQVVQDAKIKTVHKDDASLAHTQNVNQLLLLGLIPVTLSTKSREHEDQPMSSPFPSSPTLPQNPASR